MKNKIDENKNITGNSKQVALLKQKFPSCFDKDGNFMPDKMAEIVKSEDIDVSKEGYSLNWLGKSYARLLANLNTETLIAENAEYNSEDINANSENVLFQGDNLDVLKHLKNSYGEQVKMIYIDPPYNTGGDGFVYEDDRKFTAEELSHLAGISEEEAKRVLEFTQSKSNSHSAWLTFMYPRLYIAKELLHDDGVIFISIDDNEQAQLKMLCDEVFGEENFVTTFCWEKKKKPSFLNRNLGSKFEYIISYAKQKENTGAFSVDLTEKGKKFPFNNAGNQKSELTFPIGSVRFNMPDQVVSPQDMSEGNIQTRLLGDLKIKDGANENEFTLEGEWRYSQKKLNEIISNKENIVISKIPFRPNHVKKGGEIKKMHNFLSIKHYNIETNEDAEAEQVALLGKSFFDYAKPSGLIALLIKAFMHNDNKGLVLDFFAGTGTTAHAVMQLNAEENDAQRRYIAVQLDEATDPKSEARKAGYKSIYDITKERITRAAKKIQEDYPDAKCDFGFKEFKTIPVFHGYLDDADTPEEFTLFDGNSLSKEQRKQLLLTWQVDDGLPLTLNLTPIKFGEYTAYQGAHIIYFIEPELVLDNIIEMLKKLDTDDSFKPQKIVIFEYSLSSKAKREITEAIKGYLNKKDIEIHLEVRF